MKLNKIHQFLTQFVIPVEQKQIANSMKKININTPNDIFMKQSASFAIDMKNINVRIINQTIAIKDKLSYEYFQLISKSISTKNNAKK